MSTIVEAPSDHQLDCGLFNDTAMLRLPAQGRMDRANRARGDRPWPRSPVLRAANPPHADFGHGQLSSASAFRYRPGAGHALKGRRLSDYLDAIDQSMTVDTSRRTGCSTSSMNGSSPEELVRQLEELVRELRSTRIGAKVPDPLSVLFEALAFADPTASIAEIARELRRRSAPAGAHNPPRFRPVAQEGAAPRPRARHGQPSARRRRPGRGRGTGAALLRPEPPDPRIHRAVRHVARPVRRNRRSRSSPSPSNRARPGGWMRSTGWRPGDCGPGSQGLVEISRTAS